MRFRCFAADHRPSKIPERFRCGGRCALRSPQAAKKFLTQGLRCAATLSARSTHVSTNVRENRNTIPSEYHLRRRRSPELQRILQIKIGFSNINGERARNRLLFFCRVKNFPVAVQRSKNLSKIVR